VSTVSPETLAVQPGAAEYAPAPAAREDDLPVTVIGPGSPWRLVDVAELWAYRELLFFLVWRDVKVRYKQTALGAAWAVLQPLAAMLVFTLFLGRLGAASSDLPYPLFVFAGLLPWTFFAGAVTAASQSVVGNQGLVTKVYFPRLLIPVSAAGAPLVDFGITSVLLLGMMLAYGVVPGWGALLVPALVLGLVVAALGVGALLAALTVAYRDFRHVVPFLVQVWMFATACIYLEAPAVVGPRWVAVLPLNPAYGLVANFRQALTGRPLDLYSLAVSGSVAAALFVLGCAYFRRVERTFADVI
jgi:lipopolysaccharide transport system permease protein